MLSGSVGLFFNRWPSASGFPDVILRTLGQLFIDLTATAPNRFHIHPRDLG
ncbi:MAG TPA: hypothetical protein VIN60_02165 [Anaerolineales bacterium]